MWSSDTAPQHTPIHFAAVSPDKIIAALRGRYFLQIEPYVVVQFSEICFSCWLYNLKVLFLCLKEAERSVRTAPGFLHTAPWILNKPSERDTVPWPHTFRERAGQRRCKTGAGTSFGANGDQHTRAVELSTYFCVLTIRKHLLKIRFERSGRGQEPSRGHKFSILENVVLHWDFTSAMRLHFRSDLVGACLPQTLLMVRTWWCEQQRRVVLYITSPRSYRTDRRYNDQNECSTDS